MKKLNLKCATVLPTSARKWRAFRVAEGVTERGNGLVVDMLPDEIGQLPVTHRLIYVDVRDDSEYFIALNGGQLRLWAVRKCNQPLNVIDRFICELNSNLCDIAAVGEYLVLLCADGVEYLRFDNGGYQVVQLSGAVPYLTFSVSDKLTRTVSIPEIKFDNALKSWHGQLDAENAAKVRKALNDAYTTLTDDAAARGKFVQPVLVRYIVRGCDDSIVYASAPVMVGCGLQGTASIASKAIVADGSYVGVQAAEFKITDFNILAECHKSISPSCMHLIKSVDILVAETKSPISGNMRHSMNSQGVNNYTLTASLDAIDTADFVHFQATSPRWMLLATLPISSLTEGSKFTIRKSAELRTRSCGSTELTLAARNFTTHYMPKAMTTTGGMLLLAGGTVDLLPVWNPAEAFAKVDNSPCELLMAVSKYDGYTTLQRTHKFSLPVTPTAISPVISVPGLDVDSFKIQITTQNGLFSRDFTISQSVGDGFCYALDSSLTPCEVVFSDECTVTEPSDIVPTTSCTSRIVTSLPGNPFACLYDTDTGIHGIKGIAPAHSPATSGVFNHYPIFLFAAEGVYAASYEPANKVSRLPRKLTAMCVADSCDSIIAAPRATYFGFGSHIYALEGTRCNFVAEEINAADFAFRADTDELYVATAEGKLVVLNSSNRAHTIPDFVAQYLLEGASGQLYAISGSNAVCQFSVSNRKPCAKICMKSHPIEVNMPIDNVTWNLKGRNMNLKLNTYAVVDSGTDADLALLDSHIITGRFCSPITVPILAPRFFEIVLEIEGRVDVDFRMGEIIINK